MFKSFLLLLEKLGRHEALVDGFGKVYWHRYYLFYRDRMDNPRWLDYLPNVYIHVFESEEPDGEDEHSHPWSSASVLLKGEYAESINYTERRVTKRWGLARLSHKDSHRLANVQAGTTTLFMHGFRKAGWRFYVKPHTTICETCKNENNGVCYKTPQVMNFSEYLQRGDSADTPYGKNRTMVWTVVDAAFKEKLTRRQLAVKKLNIRNPETKAEARDMMRDHLMKRVK